MPKERRAARDKGGPVEKEQTAMTTRTRARGRLRAAPALALAALAALAAAPLAAPLPAAARARTEEGQVLDLKVNQALERLYRNAPDARELASRAKGVLVIPDITKAGFLLGGAYGEGALRVNEATVGYYSMAAASFGFQAGVQTYDLALFFMTTAALERFRRSDGWEMGADAEVVVSRDGLAGSLNTTTAQKPVIAIVFGQQGLMAGVSLAGGKYSPIKR